jgi:thioredoxin 2
MSDTTQIVCPHCEGINRLPTDRLADGPRCGHCKTPLFAGEPVAVSAAGFRRQLDHSGVPLLVDFWASWCGPCRTMAPEFAAAAKVLEPHVRLLKLSTEDAPEIAQTLHIVSIPTLALFINGKERARHSGVMRSRQIAEWVRQAS